MAEAIANTGAQVIGLRDEEFALRLWASRPRMRAFAGRLAEAGEPGGAGPVVTVYGSGDYHHLTTALLDTVTEPVTVIHFDNHPDWVRVPATHNCGGWVNRALDLPNVRRVVTIGVCSDDLVYPQLKTGNLADLSSGRLEIHPWRVAPSRVWGRIGDGPGHQQVGGTLQWNCLAGQDWTAFNKALAGRLPTEAVWITIDKDVLRPEDAATNWDQGEMPLAALLESIALIAQRRRIVGVDVCGEYSPAKFADPIKRIAAWLDRPMVAPSAAALEANDRTNRALLGRLMESLP